MKQHKHALMAFITEYGIFLVLFLGVCAFLLFGLQQAALQQRQEAKRLAEESILRGVITCYALEGFYPPSYAYLEENYGVHVNEEQFDVFYDIFASNIMPDITVVEK